MVIKNVSYKIRDIVTFISSHTFKQTWNVIKYIVSKPSVFLSYRPIKLSVYVTPRCNLKCKMCPYQTYSNYQPDSYEDMSFETFKTILSKFKEASSLTITAEGEPFLNNEIFNMINTTVKEYQMTVRSSTNGILIGEKIEEILKSGLSELNISVDGIIPEKYKGIRGGDEQVFKKVINNISKLVEARNNLKSRLIVRVSHSITRNNYKEIPEIIAFAGSLGADKLYLHNIVGFNTELSKPGLCLYDDPEVRKFIQDIASRQRGKMHVRFPTLYSRKGPLKICDDPFIAIGVNSKGYVNLCCNLGTREEYGNIFKETDIWNNKQFQKIRQKFLNNSVPFSLCNFCPAIYRINK